MMQVVITLENTVQYAFQFQKYIHGIHSCSISQQYILPQTNNALIAFIVKLSHS